MKTKRSSPGRKTGGNGSSPVKELASRFHEQDAPDHDNVNVSGKRERLVQVTSTLFVEKGIHGVPVSLIARKADVAIGTFYIYFKTKQDLVHAVYEKLLFDITQNLLAKYHPSGSVKERFFGYYSALFEYLLDNPQQARLLLYLSTTPYIEQGVREKMSDDLLRTQMGILTEGKDKGLLKDEHPFPYVSLWFIYGSLLFLVNKELIRNRVAKSPEKKQRILEMWWDGIKRTDAEEK